MYSKDRCSSPLIYIKNYLYDHDDRYDVVISVITNKDHVNEHHFPLYVRLRCIMNIVIRCYQ